MAPNKRSKTARENGDAAAQQGDAFLQEQLDRARAAVERSKVRTEELHVNWRQHLLRLSYLVIVVTLHQTQAPMRHCIEQFKLVNDFKTSRSEQPFTGTEAMFAVAGDSVVEILSVVCVACLARLLSRKAARSDFATKWYNMSTVCIPMIVSLYLRNGTIGCIEDTVLLQQAYGEGKEVPEVSRNFPIALIFHAMVTVCLWFMQYQSIQQEENVAKIEKLTRDLAEAQRKQQTKKVR